VDNTKEPYTVLSLCTGYGGLEQGIRQCNVDLQTLCYVEIEGFAIANLVNKMETGKMDVAPIWTNLKTIRTRPFRGRVEILTGGYPCQPFSTAGNRKGTKDPRHLWPYILRIVRDVRPKRVFFENVDGHISVGLEQVLRDLERAGYKTAWGIFSAAEAGAPHQRKRVYIMGNSKHNGLPATTIGRGAEKTSNDDAEGTYPPSKSEGTSQLSSSADLSGKRADTQSKRVQGLRSGRKQEPQAHERQILSMRDSKGCGHAGWEAEPDVGRVVDGCADRVDRIRLLGNGVVPQTAAIAWRVLEEELLQDDN